MLTVVETAPFLRQAEKLFSEHERMRLIDFLSAFPMAGDEIVGSGGLRKVRYAIEGKGKSGGARVIYFFHNEKAPLPHHLLRQERKGEPFTSGNQ